MIRSVCVSLAVALAASVSSAQVPGAGSVGSEIFAGSEPEEYLRYLQTVGKVRLYPWSSRAFSPLELDRLLPRDSGHPWSARVRKRERARYALTYDFIQPAATVRFNSAFPFGSNDGPVWAGRGITSAIQAGVALRYGPVSLTVAPVAFVAQNQAFETVRTGRPGDAAFGDPLFGGVDRPQRFGSAAYAQVDPGESTFRVDLPLVTAGVSTANMTWGPGSRYPLLLGNNAAGFPHLFLGSSEPLDVWIAKLHGRVIWGYLEQSAYSSVTGPSRYVSRAEPGKRRFASGFVASIQPRGLTGLELGAARFIHSIWPSSGIPRSYIAKPFQGLLKEDLDPDRPRDPRFPQSVDDRGVSDNQLASLFLRWVLPRSGFEIAAEYGREDHAADMRDLIQEPDHSRFYAMSARKVLSVTPGRLTALRAELINFQLPQLARYRGGGEVYIHGLLRQGHTHRGQLLGADVGVHAAAGSTVALDRFTRSGSWSVRWERQLSRDVGTFVPIGVREARTMDVSHILGAEVTRFVRGMDLRFGIAGVQNFNRNNRSDAFNLNALAGARYGLP